MKCRRCGLEVEIDPGEEGFPRITEIQGYQCPAAIPGIGHWLKAVK